MQLGKNFGGWVFAVAWDGRSSTFSERVKEFWTATQLRVSWFSSETIWEDEHEIWDPYLLPISRIAAKQCQKSLILSMWANHLKERKYSTNFEWKNFSSFAIQSVQNKDGLQKCRKWSFATADKNFKGLECELFLDGHQHTACHKKINNSMNGAGQEKFLFSTKGMLSLNKSTQRVTFINTYLVY